MTRRAYLDYAATAPFDRSLLDDVDEMVWANAGGLYAEGRAAHSLLEDARARIARALGARVPSELVFTSGGTESDNTAVSGLACAVPGKRTHVVVSAIEHEAVLEAAARLKGRGFIVDRLMPDSCGVVRAGSLEALLDKIEQAGEACCLVAVQMVNNELGTVQPVSELARIAHEHGARFFTDAVQAVGKVKIDLDASGVDAAAFSAHKIGAFKGTGILYLRRSVRCPALLVGGGQESGMRSGTQNVLGAVVQARAFEKAVEQREQVWERLAGFRKRVVDACAAGGFAHALTPTIAEVSEQTPHVLSMLAQGLEGQMIVLRADEAGIALSSGSACSTRSLDPSHVLLACGIGRDCAFGSVRLSFGPMTVQDDIDAFIAALPQILR